jgi:hypothetical protein
MTIVDKYIGIWVTHDELEAILGLDVAIAARVFMLGGKVVAESPGIGLWVELEFVATGDPAENLFPELGREKPRRLVRWQFMRAAEIFDTLPAMDRLDSFEVRAA